MKQVNLSLLRLFKHFFSCYHGNFPPFSSDLELNFE